MRGSKKPLYRTVNSRTHGVQHGSGNRSRWERNKKKSKNDETKHQSMHSGQRHGLDYTPLFRFLLSKVGQEWDDIHREAISRLDREEPIFWMVARDYSEGHDYVRVGESTYFSGLYVDENNILSVFNPDITSETMLPTCACCTHTFNGTRLTTVFADNGP